MTESPSPVAPQALNPLSRAEQLTALLAALVAASLVFSVLAPALYANRAQSFDVLLYSRGLWGVAHGQLVNPVAGVSAFAVHTHAGYLVLTPLAWVMDPLAALLLGQAGAFGALTYLVGAASMRALPPSPIRVVTPLVGLALLLLSPWLSNAFLYDVRPDMLAVPVALAALLRLQRTRALTTSVLALSCCAVALREEMAIPLVSAFLLAPGLKSEPLRRLSACTIVGGLWVFYVVWGRQLLGGAVAEQRVDGTVEVFLGVPPDQWASSFIALLPNRLTLVLIAAVSGGGLAIASPRWFAAALLPMAWVLVSLRQPDEALHFHYTLFAAPVLLTACVDAVHRVRRVVARGSRERAAVGISLSLSLVVAIMLSLTWSSWPWGARYASDRYDALSTSSGPAVERVHTLLDAAIEEGDGVALPWSFVGGRAGRPFVWSTARLIEALQQGAPLPAELDVVAIIRSDAVGVVDELIARHGFVLVGPSDEPLLVLRRVAAP